MAVVDVAFINPFIKSTQKALTTMAGVKTLRKTKMHVEKEFVCFGDVSGVMGLSGKAKGSVAVSFTATLAKKIIAGMLGVDPASISDSDMLDGVGEIINLISGGAKTEAAGTEYEFSITVPQVVSGKNHSVRTSSKVPCVVITLDADGEEFSLQVSLSYEGQT